MANCSSAVENSIFPSCDAPPADGLAPADGVCMASRASRMSGMSPLAESTTLQKKSTPLCRAASTISAPFCPPSSVDAARSFAIASAASFAAFSSLATSFGSLEASSSIAAPKALGFESSTSTCTYPPPLTPPMVCTHFFRGASVLDAASALAVDAAASAFAAALICSMALLYSARIRTPMRLFTLHRSVTGASVYGSVCR
mmetsp:Transcript_11596/g.29695  ORF Transcript_11596/g.29695 Transcript_11596/m.29695 type:complete len:201 (-) Transcript_11596:829-1431(-)